MSENEHSPNGGQDAPPPPTEHLNIKVTDNCRTLNDTIQNLATTNILLKTRITGYQRALQNEQKKRQRAKPLFHRLAAAEDGKAIFYPFAGHAIAS
jgi:hypothetical protein